MNPKDTIELDDSIREVARRLHHLIAEQKAITEEITALKAKLRSTLTPGQIGTIDGTPAVAVRAASRKFDADRAKEIVPPDLLALCLVVDPGTAKRVLPPALYDSCMVEGGEPVVRIL